VHRSVWLQSGDVRRLLYRWTLRGGQSGHRVQGIVSGPSVYELRGARPSLRQWRVPVIDADSFFRLALTFATVATALLACTSSTNDTDRGGCGTLPPFSCNVQAHALLTPYDVVRGCFGAPVAVLDACRSSVGTSCFAHSIGPVCAIAPNGDLYFVFLRGDEDVTGPGWRTTHHRDGYGPMLPPEAMATVEDEIRCEKAQCAKVCDGTRSPFFCNQPDAGGVDSASDATVSDASGE
jgi:hypothetical protein